MLSERQQNPYHENSDYLKMHLTCTSMQALGNIMSYFAYKILFVTHIFHLVYPGSKSPFEFCDFYHNAISRAMCLCNCLKKNTCLSGKPWEKCFSQGSFFIAFTVRNLSQQALNAWAWTWGPSLTDTFCQSHFLPMKLGTSSFFKKVKF